MTYNRYSHHDITILNDTTCGVKSPVSYINSGSTVVEL